MGQICLKDKCTISEVVRYYQDTKSDPKTTGTKLQSSALRLAQKLLQANKGRRYGDAYDTIERVSYGATCTVYLGRCRRSARTFAVKIMPKSKLSRFSRPKNKASPRVRVLHELAAMKLIDKHPNAPKLHEVFEDDKNFYLVMDYYSGGELFDHVVDNGKGFTESRAAEIMKTIMEFLAHCHANGLVHADLKPENIVYSHHDGELKVIDFGMSVFCRQDENLDNVFGTIEYSSPEMANKSCGQKTDVWSAGVLLYFLLSGSPPFIYKNREAVLCRLKKHPKVCFNNPVWDNVSDTVKDFIRQLLTPEAHKRPTADEALKHEWLTDLNASSTSSFYMDSRTLAALKEFSQKSMIRRILWEYVARNGPQDQFSKQLDQFHRLDLDNNGTLEIEELGIALKKATPHLEDEDVSKIFRAIDIDQSGGIDHTEFIIATFGSLEPEAKDHLARHSFMKMDTLGKGIIPKDQFIDMFVKSIKNGLGREVGIDELGEEIGSMDLDGDGHISIDEFTDAIKKRC